MKVTAWVGAAVALACVLRVPVRWKVVVTLCCAWAAMVHGDGTLVEKFTQRWETWRPLLGAIREHPWVGHGFSVFAYSRAQTVHQMRLPDCHSDWLSLMFHGGLIVTALVAWAWDGVVIAQARTRWAHGLRASLIAVGVMACGQSVVSEPRLLACLVCLVGWAWVEQQQGVIE